MKRCENGDCNNFFFYCTWQWTNVFLLLQTLWPNALWLLNQSLIRGLALTTVVYTFIVIPLHHTIYRFQFMCSLNLFLFCVFLIFILYFVITLRVQSVRAALSNKIDEMHFKWKWKWKKKTILIWRYKIKLWSSGGGYDMINRYIAF